MKDALGCRMKTYEKAYAQKCMPLLPVCVRLDGKGFSTWTKGLDRPYDAELSSLMSLVTQYLVKETGALIGYTQSDEITLVMYSDCVKSQVFFDGKIQKIVSVLASMTTAHFNMLAQVSFPHKPLALFDCRVWQVPSLQEAVNVLVWREMDATKNSVTQAASTVYSHKELLNRCSAEKIEMLFQKNIKWNDFPNCFKRGTYVKKVVEERTFTEEEIAQLPAMHAAVKDRSLTYARNTVQELKVPKITTWANPIEFIFNNAPLEIRALCKG